MGWFSDALSSLTGAVSTAVGQVVTAVAEPVGGLLQQAAPLLQAAAPMLMAGIQARAGGSAGMLGAPRAPMMQPRMAGYGAPLQPTGLPQGASLFGGQPYGSPYSSQQRFMGFGVASQGSQYAYGNTPQSSLANAYGTSRYAMAGSGRNVSSFASPYGIPQSQTSFGGALAAPAPRAAYGQPYGQGQMSPYGAPSMYGQPRAPMQMAPYGQPSFYGQPRAPAMPLSMTGFQAGQIGPQYAPPMPWAPQAAPQRAPGGFFGGMFGF